MFCPRCAANNADDARFCRACGTDISLVPQAVTGQLATRLDEEDDDYTRRGRRGRKRGKPTIERAVRSFMMGLAFIFVAFAAWEWAPAGHIWWFWMLIPAASMLGEGVSTYIRLAEEKKRRAPPAYVPQPTAIPPTPQRASVLPPRNTGEIVPPPSVTEGTTRLLDNVPAERARDDR
ncbi:MAG TPA: zinc ribbon domain-containing protein [Pyrinomonadaceae bacterium]|nr:zinc ribbon domain-containing protein [Pyrinomonadaceae bacterium]